MLQKEVTQMATWMYEGIACYVAEKPLAGHVPLYRAWNGTDHFYTTDKAEYDGLANKYSREGFACYVATSSMGHTSLIPDQGNVTHEPVLATSPAKHTPLFPDKERLPRVPSAAKSSVEHIPLYRFYNASKDDHFYTTSELEKNNLQGSSWQFERVEGYVQNTPDQDHVAFYRAYNEAIVDHFYTTRWNEIVAANGLIPPIVSADVDLIVRTINTKRHAAHYPIRLHGIAQKFHEDWPSQVGLIGMQEVKGEMTGCQAGPSHCNGARCFAAELSNLFGETASGRYSENNQVGLVAGGNWKIISTHHWGIGAALELDGRYLIEALVQHQSLGCRMRFYSTHLSNPLPHQPNTRKERRLSQAKDVVSKVRERAQPGELPPIVVGDFNAGRVFGAGQPEESVLTMEAHFWRPIDTLNLGPNPVPETGVDIIYIGRQSSFPKSKGIFRPIERRHIPMGPTTIVGFPNFTDKLTDHSSEGFTFKIEM